MSGKWFKRMLLSYLPVFVGIVVVLLAFFIYMANRISAEQARQANQLFAVQVIGTLDLVLKNIDQLITKELDAAAGLGGFFAVVDADRYNNLYLPSQKINEMMALMPEIASIYLYRAEDGMVLTRDTVTDEERFGDAEFIRVVREQGVGGRWLPMRSYKELAEQEAQQAISLVRKVPLLTGEQGFAVISVHASTIAKLINEMSISRFGFVDLKDQHGNYLVKNSPDTLRSELSTASSSYSGWQLESGLRDGGVFHFLAFMPYMWLGLLAVVILLGIAWIVLATRRNSKPLELVADKIRTATMKQSRVASQLAGMDEFKFIDAAFTELIAHSNEIQQKHKDDLQYRRQKDFQDLLLGNRPFTGQEWQEAAERFGLPAQDARICVATIGIDRYTAFTEKYSYRDQVLLKFVIRSVVMEIAEKQPFALWAEWMDSQHLAMLIAVPDSGQGGTAGNAAAQASGAEDGVAALCAEVNAWIRSNLQLTVTAGLGSGSVEAIEIPVSYEEALAALKYKAVSGTDRVITIMEVKKPGNDRFHSYESIRALVDLFKQGHGDWEAAAQRLFEELNREVGSQAEVLAAMDYLNYQLHYAIQGMADGYRDYWAAAISPRLHEIGNEAETLQEVQAEYMLLLREAAGQFRELRDQRSGYALVQRIKQYIDGEYASAELSLNRISEHFELSSKYVSQLFREETGVKFVDYLARLRVEHAKQLLRESDLPIQDIALQVGYEQALSFIRMFKKLEGVTPGDYRKQHS